MGVMVWQFPQFETPDPLNVLNISERISWNSHCDSRFIANSGKSINLKTRFDALLFIQNNFMVVNIVVNYAALGVISGITTVNAQQKSR